MALLEYYIIIVGNVTQKKENFSPHENSVLNIIIIFQTAVSPEPTSMPDPKMVEFLTDLGLEKYVTVLHEKEIDFQALINFTDEDLKGVGIK